MTLYNTGSLTQLFIGPQDKFNITTAMSQELPYPKTFTDFKADSLNQILLLNV
jgi:hypothetical protein